MATINLVTDIPGPKSQAILQRRLDAVTSGLGRATEVVIDRAEGAVVHDVDGNTFIDLIGGIGMLGVGHSPQFITRAMQEQAEKYIHLCAIVGTYEPYVELCELLNDVAPGDFRKKSLLANSGSEAVENAVKFARAYTGRSAVISFENAYHGRTLMALSLTSKYNLFKKSFGPFASEVYRLPFPYLYRKPAGVSDEEFVEWHVSQLRHALTSQVDPEHVAAIIIEPIQGEGGFLATPPRFLSELRAICDEHGIVMIADEIQAGMGRTGKLFSIEHYDVIPDIVIAAKSLGAGMPISSITGRAEIIDAPHPGGVGGTYGGNPLACVAAIEAIKWLREPQNLAKATRIGEITREVMGGWMADIPAVGDIRGVGAMQLVELVKDRESKEPAPAETLAALQYAYHNGVISLRAGIYANCIRVLPPLVITEDQLREGLAVLEAGIRHAMAEAALA